MSITKARSKVASAARYGTPQELHEARQEFGFLKLKQQIGESYPMTLEQRKELARLLMTEEDLL